LGIIYEMQSLLANVKYPWESRITEVNRFGYGIRPDQR
jgi:hypothetical protein